MPPSPTTPSKRPGRSLGGSCIPSWTRYLDWSLDGGALSALQPWTGVVAGPTNVWTVWSGGRTAPAIQLCDRCASSSVAWSPDGTRLAAYFRIQPAELTGPWSPGIAIVDLPTGAVSTLAGVPDLGFPTGGDVTGWIDERTLLAVQASGRGGLGITITNPVVVRELGPGYNIEPDVSPNTLWYVETQEGVAGNAELLIQETNGNGGWTIARGPGLWSATTEWSPDSRLVIFTKWDLAAQAGVDGVWIVDPFGRDLRQGTALDLRLVDGGWQPTWQSSSQP